MKKIERIIMALCFLVLVLCSRYLLDYCLDSLENRQTYQQVEDIAFPQDDDDVERGNTEGEDTEQAEDFDFQALLAENADCIGWLSIPGTDISYPVVQGTDNEYYLHHDFYKNVASCGTLFLDYRMT